MVEMYKVMGYGWHDKVDRKNYFSSQNFRINWHEVKVTEKRFRTDIASN